jgi:hypothetical protein
MLFCRLILVLAVPSRHNQEDHQGYKETDAPGCTDPDSCYRSG